MLPASPQGAGLCLMLETGNETKFLLETQQTGEKERDPKKSPRYSGDRRSDGGK